MNGEPYTVLGVMPRNFPFPDRLTAFFWPSALGTEVTQRGSHYLAVVARLKPGVTLAAAQAEMQTIARRLEAEYPGTNTKIGTVVVPLREQITEDVRAALLVLLVAAGCVLLITCSNLANLMLARSTGRQRELAVRSALGAGRARLVRQMLTESSILALLGGVVGVAVAHAGTRLLETLVPQGLPGSSLVIDGRVLAFSSSATALTALLFGLLPALKSARVDWNGALTQGSRGGIGGPSRWVRNTLVVSEVALAIVLLVGAGLMIETLRRMRGAETGFRPDHLLTLRLTLPAPEYPDQQKRAAFYAAVLERVQRLPGVRSAAFAGTLPFTSAGNTYFYAIDGRPEPGPGNTQDALYRPVTRDYNNTIGARLMEGRWFTVEDHAKAPLKDLPVSMIRSMDRIVDEHLEGRNLHDAADDLCRLGAVARLPRNLWRVVVPGTAARARDWAENGAWRDHAASGADVRGTGAEADRSRFDCGVGGFAGDRPGDADHALRGCARRFADLPDRDSTSWHGRAGGLLPPRTPGGSCGPDDRFARGIRRGATEPSPVPLPKLAPADEPCPLLPLPLLPLLVPRHLDRLQLPLVRPLRIVLELLQFRHPPVQIREPHLQGVHLRMSVVQRDPDILRVVPTQPHRWPPLPYSASSASSVVKFTASL
jgi:hypothetical protein